MWSRHVNGRSSLLSWPSRSFWFPSAFICRSRIHHNRLPQGAYLHGVGASGAATPGGSPRGCKIDILNEKKVYTYNFLRSTNFQSFNQIKGNSMNNCDIKSIISYSRPLWLLSPAPKKIATSLPSIDKRRNVVTLCHLPRNVTDNMNISWDILIKENITHIILDEK